MAEVEGSWAQQAGVSPPPNSSSSWSQPSQAVTHEKKPSWIVIFGEGFLILMVFIAIIGVIFTPESRPGESNEAGQADELMKDAAGPNNPIAQKILHLNTAAAYSVGYKDGIMEFANMAQKFSQMPGDMLEQLNNAQELKNYFFDLMGTQNKFDPLVFAEYRRGWNAGWNNHGVSR